MRTIALLLALALGTALAQERSLDFVAGTIANHLDAITVDCPEGLGLPAACYVYVADVDIHKMALDVFAMGVSDFRWIVPWQQMETGLGRAFDLGGVAYLIALTPNGERGSMALVFLSDDL